MRKVDGFLSQQAQVEWPTAIIWKEEASSPGNGNGNGSGERFILERHGMEDILLGNKFQEARAGLTALLVSERSKKTIEGKEN
jgi:hypothetical protein